MSAPKPPRARPRTVVVAFWLWIVAATLILVNGIAGVTASFGAVRAAAKPEITDEQVRQLVTYFRAWGVLCMVLALAIAYLADRTRQGHAAFRRALVALSLVSVLGALLMAGFGSVGPVLLIAALSLIAASILIIRPSARAWFDGGRDV